MKLTQNIDAKVGVFDIECYVELFDVGIYDPDTKVWYEFEVSKRKNDLYKFVKFYQDNTEKFDYVVGFNSVEYDQQVLQYVLRHYQEWADLTNLEICKKISNFSSNIIDNGKYNIPVPYKEDQFPIKPIDVYKVNHFDNDAKRTSLKWCEFMMDMDVEEMPIPWDKRELADSEIDLVIKYRRHDVMATVCLLYVTLGDLQSARDLIKEYLGYDVTLSALLDYQDKNQIETRFVIMEESGLLCLNWSDVKIGEEMNKQEYMKSTGVTKEKDLFPTSVKQPYGQPFSNFFPNTVSYQHPDVVKFTTMLAKEKVRVSTKENPQEYPFTFGGSKTTYNIAKGGIHSCEKHRKIIPPPGMILRDADVGAQYPRAIEKYCVCPPHLDPIILTNFSKTVKLKAEYKALGKKVETKAEQNRFKGLETSTKLKMNGGYFGKLGQPGSFLEFPEGVLKITMGNQLEILMLIEMLEAEGINVVSGNTDGIVSYFPEHLNDKYFEVCAAWEKKVGNDVLGKLEYADFAQLHQESINHYIARTKEVDKDGNIKYKTKKKGRFMTEFELHKNKSKRIIPLALEQYFINKVDPVEYIRNHDYIFDFLIGKKAFADLHYEELDDNKKVIANHHKVLAYYVSNDGNIIKKRGWHKNNKGILVYMDAFCEAEDRTFTWLGVPKLTTFNRVIVKPMKEYNINYDYYIIQTLKRIDQIERTKKAKSYAEKLKPQQQTSMF